MYDDFKGTFVDLVRERMSANIVTFSTNNLVAKTKEEEEERKIKKKESISKMEILPVVLNMHVFVRETIFGDPRNQTEICFLNDASYAL
jgi:hypothetical protein